MRSRAATTRAVKRDLRGSGLLRSRPDRTLRVSRAVRRWGATPAGACQAASAAFPARTAILDDHGGFSFAELNERSAALSAAFHERGIAAGATILVRAANHHWLIETLIAAARLNANVLALDPRMGDEHLRLGARCESPVGLVLDRPHLSDSSPVFLTAAEARQGGSGESLDRLIATAGRAPAPIRARTPARVVLSRLAEDGSWLTARRSFTLNAPAARCAIPLRRRGTTMICAPLSSPWGHLHMTLALRLGSTLVLSERFEALEVLAALEEHSVNALALTPPMLAEIVALPAATLSWYRTPALSVIALGSPSVPAQVAIPAMRRFGRVLYTRRGPAMVTLDPAPVAHRELALAAAV